MFSGTRSTPARTACGSAPISSPRPQPTSSTRASLGISRTSASRRSPFMKSRAAGCGGDSCARRKYSSQAAASASEREGFCGERSSPADAAVAAFSKSSSLFLFHRVGLLELLARPDHDVLVAGEVQVGAAERQLVLAARDALRVWRVSAGVLPVDPDLGPRT